MIRLATREELIKEIDRLEEQLKKVEEENDLLLFALKELKIAEKEKKGEKK